MGLKTSCRRSGGRSLGSGWSKSARLAFAEVSRLFLLGIRILCNPMLVWRIGNSPIRQPI